MFVAMANKIVEKFSFIGLIISLLFSSCISTKNPTYQFNQKYSSQAVKEDLATLKEVFTYRHPALHWHITEDSLNLIYNQIYNSITDSLTEQQARNKIATWVSFIRCGHTSVRFSKQYNKEASKHIYPIFPLLLKAWGKDSVVVLARYNKEDSALHRGAKIIAINNIANKDYLQKMYSVMSMDGLEENYKAQVISGNFPLWYKNSFGIDSLIKIDFIDSTNTAKTINIKAFTPIKKNISKKDSTNNKPQEITKISRSERRLLYLRSLRDLRIDTINSTAYIRLTTFSGGKLKRFFRKTFATINELKLKNVVFDIRENGGGRVNNAINLSRYLKQKRFKVADTVVALRNTLKHTKHIKLMGGYLLAMQLSSRTMKDGLMHTNTYEKHFYKPKSKNFFSGQIFIVQGAQSFSAATMFSGWLKNQANVTIVGEPSGGGYYGNSAMFLPKVYLPNTKLIVGLPLYKVVLDKNRNKGFGVPPDVYIPPNSRAIQQGIDLKMKWVKAKVDEPKN
jgi:C-terminal processing protease CtpA/Prc